MALIFYCYHKDSVVSKERGIHQPLWNEMKLLEKENTGELDV